MRTATAAFCSCGRSWLLAWGSLCGGSRLDRTCRGHLLPELEHNTSDAEQATECDKHGARCSDVTEEDQQESQQGGAGPNPVEHLMDLLVWLGGHARDRSQPCGDEEGQKQPPLTLVDGEEHDQGVDQSDQKDAPEHFMDLEALLSCPDDGSDDPPNRCAYDIHPRRLSLHVFPPGLRPKALRQFAQHGAQRTDCENCGNPQHQRRPYEQELLLRIYERQ